LSIIGGPVTVTLNRNTFEGNFGSSVGGGLLAAFSLGSIALNQNQFIENSVNSHGSGAYIDTDLVR